MAKDLLLLYAGKKLKIDEDMLGCENLKHIISVNNGNVCAEHDKHNNCCIVFCCQGVFPNLFARQGI